MVHPDLLDLRVSICFVDSAGPDSSACRAYEAHIASFRRRCSYHYRQHSNCITFRISKHSTGVDFSKQLSKTSVTLNECCDQAPWRIGYDIPKCLPGVCADSCRDIDELGSSLTSNRRLRLVTGRVVSPDLCHDLNSTGSSLVGQMSALGATGLPQFGNSFKSRGEVRPWCLPSTRPIWSGMLLIIFVQHHDRKDASLLADHGY
ncbi:hypothetical protein CONLIGDRAFT_46503 [Coniochaeta ligniaria NRRL 30616]|uniref:Uncharacterized protein n=1 Tax=Coniochaeta ligniaria NRRL 30616 TaxID=1408157 RepID=A0A1J7JPA8_9PEZI|nr:hypothetical protein CONLIGDRAFT_46503 [Coniochaeta ligniaria NRRL 30616]